MEQPKSKSLMIERLQIPGSFNTMIFATKQETKPENFAMNLVVLSQNLSVNPLLIAFMQTTFGI